MTSYINHQNPTTHKNCYGQQRIISQRGDQRQYGCWDCRFTEWREVPELVAISQRLAALKGAA